jgi:photosystem II stability/assembly factor-like uncharacterized protein
MRIMKIIYQVLLLLLFMAFAACSKKIDLSHDVPPPSLDTLGSWTKTDSLSDIIYDIAFLTPAKGYCAGNGIYRSLDSGKHWTRVISGGYYTDLLFVDAQFGFAKGFTKTQPQYLQEAFTVDGGTTWKEMSLSYTGVFNDFCFTSHSTGYYSAEDGIYKTIDTGKTLQKVYTFGSSGIYFFDDNNGFAFTINGIRKTNDGGSTWPQANNLALSSPLGFPKFLQFTDINHGWLTADKSFYKINNGGSTYTETTFGTAVGDVQFVNNLVGYIAFLNEIYKTIDGGNTWTRSCKIGLDNNFKEIFFLDEHTGWACSQSGTTYRLKE